MRLLTSLSCAVLAALGQAQTHWYVDVNGTAPGTGTQRDPFTKIRYALENPAIGNWDTIWVAPGEYPDDRLHVPPNRNLFVTTTGGPSVTRMIAAPGHYAISCDWDGSSITLTGLHIRTAESAASINSGRFYRCIVEKTGPKEGVGFRNTWSLRLENCTVTGFGTAISEFGLGVGGDVYLNTLFYGNGVDMLSPNGYAATKYCSYQGGQPFQPEHNIVGQDPQLWNLAASDFHLAPLSHCIDAGDPAMLDPDGTRIDIGAIPYDASYAATPTTYCTPKPNSLGCKPLLSWSGAASLTGPDDFVLSAAPALNEKVGKFIWATAPTAAPFLGGTLCVRPPFVRGPLVLSGGSGPGLNCSGSYAWPFTQAYMASHSLSAGTIVYAQAWGRDPGFPEPHNSQLSDAIVFQILP